MVEVSLPPKLPYIRRILHIFLTALKVTLPGFRTGKIDRHIEMNGILFSEVSAPSEGFIFSNNCNEVRNGFRQLTQVTAL